MGVHSGGGHEHLARVVRALVLEHKDRKQADHFRNRLCLALDLQLLVSALIRPDLPLLLPIFDRAFRQLVPLYPLVEDPQCRVLDEDGSPFDSVSPLRVSFGLSRHPMTPPLSVAKQRVQVLDVALALFEVGC
jgi:hypothetical protein